MKRKGEPASVEDLSPDTNDIVPNSRRTATHPKRSPPKRQRTIDRIGCSKTKRATSAVKCHARDPVDFAKAVQEYDGRLPMTILSGGTDQDTARHEISGYHLRKFFYEGKYKFVVPFSYPIRRSQFCLTSFSGHPELRFSWWCSFT